MNKNRIRDHYPPDGGVSGYPICNRWHILYGYGPLLGTSHTNEHNFDSFKKIY